MTSGDRQTNVRILSVGCIFGSADFNCFIHENGTVEVQHRASGIQYSTFWRNNVLSADITVGAYSRHVNA